ncbi:TPA: hypothetical protein ACVU0F_004483, partial [Yersinia enterocolitica]
VLISLLQFLAADWSAFCLSSGVTRHHSFTHTNQKAAQPPPISNIQSRYAITKLSASISELPS